MDAISVTVQIDRGEEGTSSCRAVWAYVDNLPCKDSIEIVNGLPQFVQADVFETVWQAVRDTFLNMTENPGECGFEELEEE